MPCPIGIEPIDEPLHCLRGSSRPADSFGNRTAVLAPKPNLRRYWSTFAAPMRCASWMVPMFDDTVRIPATVSWLGSCSASPKVAPPSWRCSGIGSTVAGFATPCSSAADTVIILFTEPGSNTVVTAALFDDACTLPVLGSSTMWAIDRISPVDGSLMITMPPFDPVFCTWAASSRSVSYCRSRSRDSTTSVPAFDGVSLRWPPAIGPRLESS